MSDLVTTQLLPVAVQTPWMRHDAIDLCCLIEQICPKYGCHVALTGGLLYKFGPRKDCDLLFYRIREAKEIAKDGLWAALSDIGFEETEGFGWCHKATFRGKPVDCFFPEEDGGTYATNTEPLPPDPLEMPEL